MIERSLPSSRNLRPRQLANTAGRVSLPPRYVVEGDARYTSPAAYHQSRPPRSRDPMDGPRQLHRSVPLADECRSHAYARTSVFASPTPGCRAATTLLLRPREPDAAFCPVSNSNVLRIRQHDFLYFSNKPSLFNQE
jgi:hypothetical protein